MVKGSAEPGGAGLQVHLDGVEALDVAGGVVNSGVVGDGVGAAVGKGEEAVGGDVGDAGAEASEQVGRSAVFESAGEAGEIGVRASSAAGEGAFGDQLDLGEGSVARGGCDG